MKSLLLQQDEVYSLKWVLRIVLFWLTCFATMSCFATACLGKSLLKT